MTEPSPSLLQHRLCLRYGIGTTSQITILDHITVSGTHAWEICAALNMKDSSVDRTLQLLRRLELISAHGPSWQRLNKLTPLGEYVVGELRKLFTR